MPNLATLNVLSTAPGASVEATGAMNLFMKCDTASSGVGLQTLEVPAFLQSYTAPSGTLNLFLDARKQRNFWGSSLTEMYAYYGTPWSNVSSTGFVSSGIVNNNIDMVVSGARVVSKYAVMPMAISVDATGTSSSFMALYTLNQEVATGEMNLFTKSHDVTSSTMNLATKGGHTQASGTMTMVATGVGFSSSFMDLYVFGRPTS